MCRRLWGWLAVALLAALCLAPTGAWADDAKVVQISVANFPDSTFRNSYVRSYDKDNNGWLGKDEIDAVKSILCAGEGIAGLKGVEHFTALQTLNCANNKITSLDVSHNTALKTLRCYGNQLSSLVTGSNTVLEELYCYSNQLTSLDLSQNTALEVLHCNDNQLDELDVRRNAALTWLDCSNNQLDSLNVEYSTALQQLYCDGNAITSLNLAQNAALRELYCSSNKLTSLNLTGTPSITSLVSDGNSYTIGIGANRQFDLTKLPSGFDAAKASNWSGGSVDAGVLTANDGATAVTYTYDCGASKTATFTLNIAYVVSFDGAGAVESQIVEPGGKVTKPADPTSPQFIFAGWYADRSCETAFDFENTRIYAPTTIYAKWVEDITAPTIGGVENGKTYCAARRVTVTDENLGSVTVDGVPVTLDESGSFILEPAVGSQTIAATDKAGNEATVTVTVNNGHAWSAAWSYDATEHWHECSVCGEKTDVGEHGGEAANCVTPAYCYTCKEEYDGVDPNNHYDLVHCDAEPATVDHVGYKECWYCHGCDKYFLDGAATKEVDGSEIIIPVLDPEAPTITGVEDGKTYCEAQKATVSDDNLASVKLNGADIVLADDQTSVELDLAAAGKYTVVAADKAGNTTTVTVTVNDGHTAVALPAKAATCTEDGLTEGSECSVCGEILVAQKTVPAAGHKGGTATCSKRAVCETCGIEYGELDPNNHEALEHVEAKEATTEAEGNIEYWRCTACGKLFSDEAATKEVSEADTVIPKKSDSEKDEGKDGKESEKKDGEKDGKKDPSLPKTGDDSATAAVPLAAGLSVLALAALAKRRNA